MLYKNRKTIEDDIIIRAVGALKLQRKREREAAELDFARTFSKLESGDGRLNK